MNTIPNEVARQRLVAWMEENNWHYVTLAERMGVHLSTTNRIMNGTRPVSAEFRWRFANVFGYETAIALFGEMVEEREVAA